MLFATQVGDLFVSGKSSREGYIEIFAAQFATLSWVELPVAKTLKKIFQSFFLAFWRLVLKTCMRLVLVMKIMCFGQPWSVFKPFQFSLEHFWLFIFFLTWLTLKITVSLSNNLRSCIISSFNLQGKVWVFVSYSLSFTFTAYSSWIVYFFLYLYISCLFMGLCFSGEIIVWFLVAIFWSTLS